VPRLSLGDASGEIEIKKGIGTIKKLSAKSKDGELAVEGRIEFRDPFKQSRLPGCMRFKLSEALKEREPDFGNIEFMLPEMARQADGEFAIPTKGTLGQLGWDPRRRCGGPDDEGSGGERGGERERPTITHRTDDGTAPPPRLPLHTGSELSEEEKLRRAGTQPTTGEPEVNQPGSSGPPLNPGAARGLRRDDVSGARDAGATGSASPPAAAPPAEPAPEPVPEPPPSEPPPELPPPEADNQPPGDVQQ
jgi:hypothetical protein